MLQFLGLAFGTRQVDVAVVGRDLSPTRDATAPIQGARTAEAGWLEVPPAEWARSGGYLLQETYLDLDVADREIWGIALASPPGWVALDIALEPLTAIRLFDEPLAAEPLAADLAAWARANPRDANRVEVVLSPKDWFRFKISGAFAADETTASRLALLRPGGRDWDPARVEAAGLAPSQLPPVFPCDARTGSLSEEGLRQTGLPGGLWLAAGALRDVCSRLASADLREGKLWAPPGAGCAVHVSRERKGAPEAEGFRASRAGWAGHVERILPIAPGESEAAASDSVSPADSDSAARARAALERAGLEVTGIVTEAGSPARGAAALAALSSGMVRDWDIFYRRETITPRSR